MSERHTPQVGRLLVGLYPARYRELHGEDIAATFAEATEGLGRRELLRERLDLASHALRLRLRIGPTDPAGRVLAGAAPVALAIAVGACLAYLLPGLGEVADAFAGASARPRWALVVAGLFVAFSAPWIVTLLFAALGRWRPARRVAVLAIFVDCALMVVLGQTYGVAGEALRLAVLGALVLLAPPDLVDTGRRGRWEVTAVALLVGLPLAGASQGAAVLIGIPIHSVPALAATWAFVVAAVLLLLHLSARRPDRLRGAGIALGASPWLLQYLPAGPLSALMIRTGTEFLVLVGGAVILGGLVRLLRRTLGTEPAEPA
ncbi:hypothetical protein AB0K43_00285 [Kitasatospora sp. NPDC049258]|uniref:hypothetical protein n=1 Tax=Kitasatospora sp. NPDC049258 TaxID=3155394 RepID=UPI003422A60F